MMAIRRIRTVTLIVDTVLITPSLISFRVMCGEQIPCEWSLAQLAMYPFFCEELARRGVVIFLVRVVVCCVDGEKLQVDRKPGQT